MPHDASGGAPRKLSAQELVDKAAGIRRLAWEVITRKGITAEQDAKAREKFNKADTYLKICSQKGIRPSKHDSELALEILREAGFRYE